jgi:hypothetical protein
MDAIQPNQPPPPREPTAQHFVMYQYPSGQTDIHMPVDPIVAFKLLAVACESLCNFHLQLRQKQAAEEVKSKIEVIGHG